jgi:hypothetical protein
MKYTKEDFERMQREGKPVPADVKAEVRRKLGLWSLLFFLVLILIGWGIFSLSFNLNHSSDSVVVLEKWTKVVDRTGKYLISATNDKGEIEVFEIRDSWINFFWSSADLYASIQPTKTYQFSLFGWRIPLISTYRCIYKIQ